MENRIIKFRAWTGNEMQYNVMAGFLGAYYVQGINENDAVCMSEFNTLYDKETPIMQVTGLKDKLGKEIYESDIVHIHLEDGEKTELVKWSESDGLWEPYLEGANEYFYTLHQLANHHGATVEIIGNIYDNPELIKSI